MLPSVFPRTSGLRCTVVHCLVAVYQSNSSAITFD
jgi:hypothetical protein